MIGKWGVFKEYDYEGNYKVWFEGFGGWNFHPKSFNNIKEILAQL